MATAIDDIGFNFDAQDSSLKEDLELRDRFNEFKEVVFQSMSKEKATTRAIKQKLPQRYLPMLRFLQDALDDLVSSGRVERIEGYITYYRTALSAFVKKPLTKAKLVSFALNEIFDQGLVVDNATGISIDNSDKILRWVAVKGGAQDWAIYVAHYKTSPEMTAKYGTKIHNMDNVSKLLPCTSEVLELYRS